MGMFRTLSTMAAGAALMYFFDAQNGQHRRELFQARMNQMMEDADNAKQEIQERTKVIVEDVREGAENIAATLQNTELENVVRSAINELVSDANEITIAVTDGNVKITGRVPETEREALLERLRGLDGVEKVTSNGLRSYSSEN